VTPPPEVLPLGVLNYPASFYCGAQLISEPLKFIFSRSMDGVDVSWGPGSASTYGDDQPQQAWSTTALANDTLTFTPFDTWTLGANLLMFTTYDTDGNPLIVWYTPHIYTSPPRYYYVSGDTGTDPVAAPTGDFGITMGAPLKTIERAILEAVAFDSAAVILVAAAPGSPILGTTNPEDSGNSYYGYDAGTGSNPMIEGISLCGGFSPNFAVRDPAAYPTVIASTATAGLGGSNTSPLATISAAGTVTNATVLDGFTIVAPGPETITPVFTPNGVTGALTVAGGLQVRNNKLVAGGPGNSVIALVHDNADPANQGLFTNNYLKGSPTAATTTTTYGLLVFEATPVFDSGYIGTSIFGAYIAVSGAGTVTVANSDIDGGRVEGANASYGIYVAQGDVNIVNNREINGGGIAGSGSSTGIQMSGSATGIVSNNKISGGIGQNSFGFTIANSPGAVDLIGNEIDGGGTPGDAPSISSVGLVIVGNTGTTGSITDNLITGGIGESSNGVLIQNATGTVLLTANNIWGGDGNVGIGVDDQGVATTLDQNWITGASASFSATAIRSVGTSLTVYSRNRIVGGLSGGTGGNFGIQLDALSSALTVRSNLITGCQGYGDSITGFYGQGPCVAIDNNGTSNQIRNNTVNGGSGAQADANGLKSVAYRQGASASGTSLVNNIFFTSAGRVLGTVANGGRCIDLTAFDTPVSSFSNLLANDLFACGGSVFNDGSTEYALETINNPYFSLGTSSLALNLNIDVDPLFLLMGTDPGLLGDDSKTDWNLTVNSAPEVRGGGFGSCGLYDDYGGTPFRTDGDINTAGGVAMGAIHSPSQILSCP
jgi:hypothetical protein